MEKPRLYIIKIGGQVIDEEAGLQAFLMDFSAVAHPKLLIHGGGKLATQLAQRLQVPQTLIEGRRITDRATLEIVTMVYGGLINKQIVARLQALGCDALGLTGADGDLMRAHRRVHATIDYGFAGDVDRVSAPLVDALIQASLTPVIAPITHDGKGQLLNTNADTIAQEMAKAMADQYRVSLIYTFEKSGVLRDAQDESTVIPRLWPALYRELRSENKIFAGMIPKLDNAFSALESGVEEVIIGKADQLPALIGHQAGTTLAHESK